VLLLFLRSSFESVDHWMCHQSYHFLHEVIRLNGVYCMSDLLGSMEIILTSVGGDYLDQILVQVVGNGTISWHREWNWRLLCLATRISRKRRTCHRLVTTAIHGRDRSGIDCRYMSVCAQKY
jgi:hypothetical protein